MCVSGRGQLFSCSTDVATTCKFERPFWLAAQLLKRLAYIEFNLQQTHMSKSLLDSYAHALITRARQGYTQRMLCLYLEHECALLISQPSISRWLAGQDFKKDLSPDDAFVCYKRLASIEQTPRRYRRALSKWRGHIEHLRNKGNSLSQIQADLKQRGVRVSIRTIRRELGAL